MCTVLLPQGVNPTAVNNIYHISYHIMCCAELSVTSRSVVGWMSSNDKKEKSGNGLAGLKKTKKNSIRQPMYCVVYNGDATPQKRQAMSRASFEPSTYEMRFYSVATTSRPWFTRWRYGTADSTHKIFIWVIVKHLRHLKQFQVEAVNIYDRCTLPFIYIWFI
jgi:hypothetical protein